MLAAMSEFDLIARYFTRPTPRAVLGVGDDCALLQPAPGTQLAISSDMLVEGRHFFADADPFALGHKALAVNLSDLAACGATPMAFTLALALPDVNETWLQGFSRGLLTLADAHGCELVGGDTTRGPLNICITVLGDARLALDALRGTLVLPPDLLAQARLRLEQPTPRVALGQALRGVATAALDLSDGLLGDLGHILKASGVGATLDTSIAIQLIAAYAHPACATGLIPLKKQLECVLAGGDDYELAFTAPPAARQAVLAAARLAETPVTRIGRIDLEPGLRLVDAQGQRLSGHYSSFDHFA